MFDDTFLLAAMEGRVTPRQINLLSLRPQDDFAAFVDRGWRIVAAGIMLAQETKLSELGIEVVDGKIDDLEAPVLIGDLAAYTEDKKAYISSRRPDVVKVNFVSSTVDGGAFLTTSDPERNKAEMSGLIALLRSAGYTCFVSTWHRDDTDPVIGELDAAEDMSLFPFNLVATKDPGIGLAMKLISEIFVDRSREVRFENAKLISSLDRKVKERDNYIVMLEEAMLALQPSEKIKIGS